MKTLLVLGLALCAAVGARAETQTFLTYDFEFEDGSVLSELRVAYETQGKLDGGRDNAILLLHGASTDRHAFDTAIGPGKTFDTNKYFVITVDAIGGGGSSSPKDGLGQDFPRYTIRDMMAAQHALVSRGLELATLRAVVGSGMGSFAGLEWGIHHPEMVRSLILLLPSPKAGPNFQLAIDLTTAAIALDPEWAGGRYTHNPVEGLRLAAMVHYPWVVSAAYLDRLPPSRLARELEESARSYGSWDANSLVLRYAASRAHDVATPFAGDMAVALSQVTAPALILPSASDRLLGLEPVPWNARFLEDERKSEASEEEAKKKGFSFQKPGTHPSHDLADYVGEYENQGYGVIRIERDDNNLKLRLNQLTSPLRHFHYDVFEIPENPIDPMEKTKMQFFMDVQGEISSLSIPLEPHVKDIVFTRRPEKLDVAVLKELAGTYETPTGAKFQVVLKEDGSLFLAFVGQPERRLIPYKGLKFRVAEFSDVVWEFVVENGKAKALKQRDPSGEFTFVRK